MSIQTHSATFAARATIRGAISLAGLARESNPDNFLAWANTYHREVQSLFSLSCKAKSLGQESFSIDGEVFPVFDITVRDQAIAALSANMRKVSSRYKDVEGHFLSTYRVAWKSKKGFHLVERKVTDDKADDGKADGKLVELQEQLVEYGQEIDLLREEKGLLTHENARLKAILAKLKMAKDFAEVRKLLEA